ncbi:hypothetical protein FBU30_002546, partial [Linnemannia zychae]
MPFVKKLKEPAAYHPAIVTNFETFLSTMKDTFGIQNANVVAETQLYHLQQKGSAIDYTTKFQEIASELAWNDAALISQYRRGLKVEVVKAMDLLSDVPTNAHHKSGH